MSEDKIRYITDNCPKWAKWMAFDKDGSLFYYDRKPYLTREYADGYDSEQWDYDENCENSGIKLIGCEKIKDKDWWKYSLKRIR